MTTEIPSERETLRDEVVIGFDQLDAGHRVPAADVYTRMEAIIRLVEVGIKIDGL